MATHLRNPSAGQGKKPQPPHGRPQRPAQPAKRHSSHALSRTGGKSVQIKEEDPEDENMAASFLQFCATCEKQIIVPSNSLLYCSESCRRKDNNKVLSYTSLPDQSPPMTPLHTFSFDDFPARDIVPQRSPTAVNSKRLSYSSFSEDDAMYSEDERNQEVSRRDSEATRYLRQFHNPEAQSEHTPRNSRPRCNRSSTTLSTLSQAPSLSHSPTSTNGMSFPYTPSSTQRPLPPRTNPFSTSYKYSPSIDLVNPFAITPIVPTTAPSSLHGGGHHHRHSSSRKHSRELKSGAGALTSHGFAEDEMLLYEKAPIMNSPSPGHGSLKQLFRFSEMQAPPSGGQGYARY